MKLFCCNSFSSSDESFGSHDLANAAEIFGINNCEILILLMIFCTGTFGVNHGAAIKMISQPHI
jgi:hypothetical protein